MGLTKCKRKRSFKKKTEDIVETRTVVSKSIFKKEVLSLSVRHGVNTSAVMHLSFCSARLRDQEFIFHFQKLLNGKAYPKISMKKELPTSRSTINFSANPVGDI